MTEQTTTPDQPEIPDEAPVLRSAKTGAVLNQAAMQVVYNYLKGLAPQELKNLQTLNSQFGSFLPAQVEAFEQEVEFVLSTFISVDPLVQQLIGLLPTS